MVDGRSLELKAQAALSAVRRVGPTLEWPDLTRFPSPLDATRCRVRFHVEGGRLGLYRSGTHELVRVPQCAAAMPVILEAVEALEGVLAEAPSEPAPDTVLVENAESGVYVAWQGGAGPVQLAGLDRLVTEGRFAGVLCRRRRWYRVLGKGWIESRWDAHDLVFRRRIGTFVQANPVANEQIRAQLLTLLKAVGADSVLDLYAGSGNLTLVAALAAKQVLGVEVDREGLAGLRDSAERNKLTNVSTYRRDLRQGFTRRLACHECDVVVLDPPRAGAREIADSLAQLGAKHIFYISCAPANLARDAASLAERYEVARLDAFDMFPRTPHVELLAHFRRRE